MTGYIGYLSEKDIPNTIAHDIPSFGLSMQYKIDENTKIYASIAQANRPVLFKDIIPTSTLERANKELKDAFGHNIEIGMHGKIKDKLKYECTLFQIQYNNKLGNIALVENGASYIYKTNVGNSQTNGIEMYMEYVPILTNTKKLSFFTATSYMKAIYQDVILSVGNENKDISGNEVESVPRWITRNGAQFNFKKLTTILQYSYVSETYSDPFNTIIPTKNGARGLVPGYGIWDLNFHYRFPKYLTIKAGINNIFNTQYFTKRPLFYPGPGVWSSDGRSFVMTLGLRI
jgi:Fe(3+) dicitrate transport protein